MSSTKDWIVFGSELSPFTLKVLAMCRHQHLPHRFFPKDGSNFENVRIQIRKGMLVNGLTSLTYPIMDDDDEFPLVPFLFGPKGENLYDSTAIAYWLDQQHLTNTPLIPQKTSALGFIINLIDEYADEIGLYMVHHNRWKLSAKNNNAGARLSWEMPAALGSKNSLVRKRIDRFFSARQTRRLPYLFSVAPGGYRVEGVIPERQPPARHNFPPTHDLLEEAFSNLLDAIEPIYASQPYLLGEHFTLADASLYGQLAMNLTDPDANDWIHRQAPTTHAWLSHIYAEKPFVEAGEQIALNQNLSPLLSEICRVFVPLMKQNYAAYIAFKQQGKHRFNEEAFDRGEQLYDGKIDGKPFRHVAKSFQAKVWRNLVTQWNSLPEEDRKAAEAVLPNNHGLDQLT